MAKFSKALVVSKPRSLVPSRTVDAQIEVLPPKKGGSQLATRQAGELSTRDAGTLTVPKKGGGTVIVSDSGGETAEQRRKRIGSGELEAMNAAGQLKGLVKAADALLVAAKLGLPVGQVMEALKPFVLSWSNKRKAQSLADGTVISRRVGGTGYGGANNKGFTKGGSKTKAGSGSAGGGTPEDPFSYVTKKRSKVGADSKPSPSGAALPSGKAEPLALGDAPKVPRPGRSAAASGFASDASGFAVSDDMQKTANKLAGKAGKALGDKAATLLDAPGAAAAAIDKGAALPGVGALVSAVKGYSERSKRDRDSKTTVGDYEAAKAIVKLKASDVLAALKRGEFKSALNLVMLDADNWASAAQQQKAMKAVENSVQ